MSRLFLFFKIQLCLWIALLLLMSLFLAPSTTYAQGGCGQADLLPDQPSLSLPCNLSLETSLSATSLHALSDEFDDPTTLSQWLEGPSTLYDTLDIDVSNPGQLTFVPSAISRNGWYADYVGPFRYKLVTGNFIVTTYVNAGNRHNIPPGDAPPTGQYNSAGFLARDPASGPGHQNYVMFNIGFQETDLSTEVKTTINSTSVLTLTSTSNVQAGELLLCRIGSTFHTYRRLDNESDWVALDAITHPDLPDTLQVGLIVNGWDDTANGSDLYAQFDYIRFSAARPTTPASCTALAEARPVVYLPLIVGE